MLQNLARGFAVLLAALSVAHAQTPTPLKVAFVYVSPIGDAGWTYQHDLGRKAMEAALGDKVQTTVVESVAEGPDSERVMRDLAAQGHTLIFATSFGYLEPALRVAADFPAVKLEHAGGYKTAANLRTYNARYYEARYLAGLLAGKTSKSGVAGYVAGFPVPEVIQGINAFTLGMREANPRGQVKVLWLNTWFDPLREREAALALVHQGADVLTNHSGSPAVAQAAEEQGVKLVAYQSDMRRHAPHAQLTAITHQWGGYYTEVARSMIAGTWTPKPVWGGMKDGLVALAPFGADVPKEAAALVEARRRAIVEGRFKPFSGRLVDSEGRVRLDKGAMGDQEIARMNWFVQGVVGSLPKQ
ncbi:MAG TPA: BMP family ABC transporter substrate-binding protein [Albitalea sp.]|uniref:BMP family ABC transporter substrate-binding protein n=1 Tax=Piscinibacter sp. TaxID=1903157 RepID=UPI002ED2867D